MPAALSSESGREGARLTRIFDEFSAIGAG
jgi:hypothetical protein